MCMSNSQNWQRDTMKILLCKVKESNQTDKGLGLPAQENDPQQYEHSYSALKAPLCKLPQNSSKVDYAKPHKSALCTE